MSSIHHDLDLISQVDGWGTLTWTQRSPGLAETHAPRRRMRAVGRRRFERLVSMAIAWGQRARQRRALRLLDEVTLRDIGIDRATSESRKPFWRA